jgi:hypothetical protein
MACYQRCTVSGTNPAQCQQQCCTNAACNQWTACVAANCSGACF